MSGIYLVYFNVLLTTAFEKKMSPIICISCQTRVSITSGCYIRTGCGWYLLVRVVLIHTSAGDTGVGRLELHSTHRYHH